MCTNSVVTAALTLLGWELATSKRSQDSHLRFLVHRADRAYVHLGRGVTYYYCAPEVKLDGLVAIPWERGDTMAVCCAYGMLMGTHYAQKREA